MFRFRQERVTGAASLEIPWLRLDFFGNSIGQAYANVWPKAFKMGGTAQSKTETTVEYGDRNHRKIRVLVVDDDRGARMALEVPLRLNDFDVTAVSTGQAAIDIGEREFFDILLTDVYMPGMNGLELVRQFRRISPSTRIIVVTGRGSLETAMQAVEEGALDFIAKPFDVEDVLTTVRRALEPQRISPVQVDANLEFSRFGIIGHSPQIVRVYKLIAHAARTRSTVLIEGETGTGKELAARAIHDLSNRAAGPFVAVNCSGLTETLLESELFGYTKGSFTGAANDRAGLFESANGGTIFLDEIGSARGPMQASLLRVLQEQEVRRVGATETREIDVRVIAASNENIEGLVQSGCFRADLYYRLSVLTIRIPPLRERGREDIELLLRYLLKKHADVPGSPHQISDEAIAVLSGNDWIGNVRELENAVEFAIATSTDGFITVSDLPNQVVERSAAIDLELPGKRFSLADDRPTLEELTRRYVKVVLAECDGNKSRAAGILDIDRRTLYRYLEVRDAENELQTGHDPPADSE